MALFLIDKVKKNQSKFEAVVKEIARKLGANPDDLMAVMYIESNINSERENTSYPFKNGYATGLIQFTPDTAISLGTTTQDLKQMSNYNQLLYVLQYLLPYKGKLKNVYDVYSAVFFPAAIGKPDNYIFETSKLSASKVARNNPIFDLNKDSKINMKEFKAAIDAKLKPLKFKGVSGALPALKNLSVIAGLVIFDKYFLE
jgi:hypothetical protein